MPRKFGRVENPNDRRMNWEIRFRVDGIQKNKIADDAYQAGFTQVSEYCRHSLMNPCKEGSSGQLSNDKHKGGGKDGKE